MKEVTLLQLKAMNFGNMGAEVKSLDFEQFKRGLIKIKGNAGHGKSTLQNAIKIGTSGRGIMNNPKRFGDKWATIIKLLDGETEVYIGAEKDTESDSVKYKLFEVVEPADGSPKTRNITKDSEGRSITVNKYMESLQTEMTFGIKDFLSDSPSTHRNFMMKLFKHKLEGDDFKKVSGDLELATQIMDQNRAICQSNGAFKSSMEAEGIDVKDAATWDKISVSDIQSEVDELLIKKGSLESAAKLEYEQSLSSLRSRLKDIEVNISNANNSKREAYQEALNSYNANYDTVKKAEDKLSELTEAILEFQLIVCEDDEHGPKDSITNLERYFQIFKENNSLPKPVEPEYIDLNGSTGHRTLLSQIDALEAAGIQKQDTESIDNEILVLRNKIKSAEIHNQIVERIKLNTKWLDSQEKVTVLRSKLSKLYAEIDTGLPGLRMMPQFSDSGKMTLQTYYTGEYDPILFSNPDGEPRLLFSHSSTQIAMIGVLMQVAILKTKEKVFPYIFVDDVPMDSVAASHLERVALENDLYIITSLTGDYKQEELQQNEILVQGGELLFSK